MVSGIAFVSGLRTRIQGPSVYIVLYQPILFPTLSIPYYKIPYHAMRILALMWSLFGPYARASEAIGKHLESLSFVQINFRQDCKSI